MASPVAPAAWTAILTMLSIAAGIAGAAVVAHNAGRREREARRRSAEYFASDLRAFLNGECRAVDLAREARMIEPGAFWAVLEVLAVSRHTRQAIAPAFARCPHVADERRALRDDSPWRRELAARRLGLVRSTSSRRALRRAMARGPENVTLAAAISLARMRDPGALQWLIGHPGALAHRTPRSLCALFRAFGRGALPTLAATIDAGPLTPAIERAMVETLGLGGFHPAAPAIERRLLSPERESRVAAARALGRLRDPASATALIDSLADSEWPVRAQSAWALGRIGDPEAIDALAARLTDRAWWVRRHAAYALARLGPRGCAALTQIARRSSDPYARDMAHEALEGGFGKPATGA